MESIEDLTGKQAIKPGAMERFATWVSIYAGSTYAFISAVALIVIWAISGPIFHFSTSWQLVVNTGTTIITFLMVFLIQKAQNKEARITQLKLNELIASGKGASNRLLSIESLSEEDLKTLSDFYLNLALKAAKDQNLRMTHSIEEAKELHERKKKYKERGE
jgi:low affinity Fe/Cu permease